MKKTTKAAQMPPSITLRLSRGRSVKITWRPRQRVSSLLVKLLTKALAVFLPLSMGYAQAADVNALPTGGQVTAGSATINQTGNTLNINQASQKAALNWQTFNIGTNGTVNFVQPNSNAVALNRIGGNSASEIYGHLNANGQVFLMNPNGILFGRGSQVNVGGIVATTMQLGDADFLAGNYNFSNAGVGSVANYGLINATNSVALLGSDVSNQGSIFATTASLVSGNTVALDVSTDGLIRARVVDVAMQANIANSGDINATQVTLSAGQAKDTLNRVVNNSGVIKATGFSSLNGEITLQGGTTLNSGTLDATSATGNGGTVHMLGQHVGLIDSGSIDVSGATGGGTILVGGDYQGKNTSIENAEVTYVGAQTTLKADATQNGNGGKVIVWADDTTRAYGSISAKGGSGGFVETSGKKVLDVAGINVNTGVGGQWLLDPAELNIIHATGGTSFGSIFDPGNVSSSTLSDSSINAAINAGANVTIQTTSTAASGGDITFEGSTGSGGNGPIVINKNSNTFNSTLTINAYGKIVFKGSTIIQTSGGGGNVAIVLMPDGQSVGSGNIIQTSSSSNLTLDGAAGEVEVMIGGVNNVNTRGTWNNEGTVTLNGNSAIRFYDDGSGTRVGSFHNMPSGASPAGILNINSSSGWSLLTATAPFGPGSSSQSGLVTNDGTINVNGTNGTSANYSAWAVLYNQGSTGVLNIGAGKTLSMQNAGFLAGNINIGNGGKLWLSEAHGGARTFQNATVTGSGAMDITGNNGDLTFSSSTVTAAGSLNITSDGAITEDINSAINTTGTFTATAVSGINLPGNNQVGTFNANNTGTGNILFNAAGSVTLGLIDAGSGTVGVTAGNNITDGNGVYNATSNSTGNNIKASYVGLTAGDANAGQGIIDVDTQVQQLEVGNLDANSTSSVKIRNTGSPLLVNAYSSDYTNTLEITNNNRIQIGHIGGAVDTTITATGASSDIQLGSIGCSCSTLLSDGKVVLSAGQDILIYDDHVNAGTGMDVTAGRDIIVTANANNASLYTASGNQNITAGRNITLTGGNSSTGAYAEIKHAGSGNQIIDFTNGGTLTLTGGTGISGNRARIENASLASNNSIQKIWRSTSGPAPAIVMNGGASGGLDSIISNDLSNSAEIGSEFGQQVIYASTIAMAGMGGATGHAGAIISAPNQQITTTGNVTLTGGSSNGVTAGNGDQFTYNTVTYNLASPAAIGDKNTLIQTLDIGGTLTLNGGSSTSGVAMVGSLHGVATGSIKANAVALNSSGSLAFLGGVEDIIVTNTFTNVGGAITDNSSGSHPWSIWALNPTKITGCGAGTGCLADFAQYGLTYGSTANPAIQGSGHGWLYSVAAPALTATTSTNYSRVYDGTANAYLTASNFTVTGANAGDTVALTSLTGNFANKNVGTAKAISGSAATLSVTAAGIPVYGYAIPTVSGLTADITQATLNWTVANATGNTGTTPVPGLATLSVIFGSDAVTGVVSAYDANNALAILSTATPEGVYTEKVTGLTGADAGNYSLASTGTTGVLTVSKSVITPEVEQEVTAVTSETISQPDDTQTKQDKDEAAAPEKVLVALNFVDDPKANKDNPIETEKPKGRTLQCSVNK